MISPPPTPPVPRPRGGLHQLDYCRCFACTRPMQSGTHLLPLQRETHRRAYVRPANQLSVYRRDDRQSAETTVAQGHRKAEGRAIHPPQRASGDTRALTNENIDKACASCEVSAAHASPHLKQTSSLSAISFAFSSASPRSVRRWASI